MRSMESFHLFLLRIGILCLLLQITSAADRLNASETLSDSGQGLVSPGGSFRLGFFSPGTSRGRYLGIWFNNIPETTVVWVANRANPINDSSGVLMIDSITGNLAILSSNGTVNVWSTNSSSSAVNPELQLLDSGNLVLRNQNDDETDESLYLWQSFDFPADKVLAGMKVGWDLRKGLNRRVSSWKSPDDPSPGQLSIVMGNSYPELMMKQGLNEIARSGPWNGLRLSGGRVLQASSRYVYDFVVNENEAYYVYSLKDSSTVTMMALNETTEEYSRYIWMEDEKAWQGTVNIPTDHCDNYRLCGPNGVCSISNSPVCQCLKGFEPKSPDKWNSLNWSDGCVRIKPLNCSNSMNDAFVKFTELKLPDTTYSWLNQSMNLKECESKCLANCSCMAYSNSNISGQGSGCAIWINDLIDLRHLTSGQDLYIRMPFAKSDDRSNVKRLLVIILAVVLPILGIMLIAGYCIHKRKRKPRGSVVAEMSKDQVKDKNLELPLFSLETIARATDNFSSGNKLGQGGFGSVYKGILEDGQEIAVKRLAHSSSQGQNEFKNEIVLISKLQHRNLVKILGCSFGGTEKMVVYEYMPNRSLDQFIFDQTQGKLTDWPSRFRIICGIARGVLYLHQDSRLRIVHRDLKASNILLDSEMNAKISDFGLARSFGGDQTEGSTNRVVGTYGYMAPEYAIDGVFSVKSDVFSFGVLLLEIVSGKKSRRFYHRKRSLNLVGHAWELWEDGCSLDLIDRLLVQSCNAAEVLRCIHIGMLCVQQHPEDRPSMSSVVLMLGSENDLPQPKQPAFLDQWNQEEVSSLSPNIQETNSSTEISTSLYFGR